jgi:hypothetical protein
VRSIIASASTMSWSIRARMPRRIERSAAEARLAEQEAEFRTWTAKGSGKTIEAKRISYAAGTVTLESREGKRSKVPLDKLSDEVQQFVAKWRKELG